MSLKDWIFYHQRKIHFNDSKWMGISAYKNPLDCWIYQEIIYEVKPDIIIEIGSAEGGSTLYLANLLSLLGKGKIISVDISHDKFKAKAKNIVRITGNSSSAEIIKRVNIMCRGKKCLVIQDGDHTTEGVTNDLINYSGLVSEGSYFIVEDGIVDVIKPKDKKIHWQEESGPLPAIKKFLKINNNFIIDKSKERYIITYNPSGFLKRIK